MMTITITSLVLRSVLIILSISGLSSNNELSNNNYETAINSDNPEKIRAFEVLTNKCNVCHEKRNKRRVFSMENMDSFSEKIYKQVFVKKRMPKGKNIKLTSNDYQDLLTWISSTKN